MSEQLKPCNCGATGELVRSIVMSGIFCRVFCEKCGMNTGDCPTPEKAAEVWNRRASPCECEWKRDNDNGYYVKCRDIRVSLARLRDYDEDCVMHNFTFCPFCGGKLSVIINVTNKDAPIPEVPR